MRSRLFYAMFHYLKSIINNGEFESKNPNRPFIRIFKSLKCTVYEHYGMIDLCYTYIGRRGRPMERNILMSDDEGEEMFTKFRIGDSLDNLKKKKYMMFPDIRPTYLSEYIEMFQEWLDLERKGPQYHTNVPFNRYPDYFDKVPVELFLEEQNEYLFVEVGLHIQNRINEGNLNKNVKLLVYSFVRRNSIDIHEFEVWYNERDQDDTRYLIVNEDRNCQVHVIDFGGYRNNFEFRGSCLPYIDMYVNVFDRWFDTDKRYFDEEKFWTDINREREEVIYSGHGYFGSLPQETQNLIASMSQFDFSDKGIPEDFIARKDILRLGLWDDVSE